MNLQKTTYVPLNFPLEENRKSHLFTASLLLLLGLLLMGFPEPGFAQSSKRKDPVSMDSPQIRTRDQEQYIIMEVSSNLPGEVTFELTVREEIRNHLLDRMQVSLAPDNPKTIRLGPYSSLWPGTYRVSMNAYIEQHPEISSDSFLKQTSRTFQSSEKALSPEKQSSLFKAKKENIIEQFRSFFLQILTEGRSIQIQKRNRELPPDKLRKQHKALRKKGQNKLNEIQSVLSELSRPHFGEKTAENDRNPEDSLADGYPFVRELRGLKRTQTIARRWLKSTLSSIRSSNESSSGQKNQQRPSEESLRKKLLNQLFRQSETLTDQVHSELGSFQREIFQHYNSLFPVLARLLPKTQEGTSRYSSWIEHSKSIQKDLRKLKNQIDRTLWLVRDRDPLPEDQKKIRETGFDLKEQIRKLSERISVRKKSGVISSQKILTTAETSTRVLLDRCNDWLKSDLKELDRYFSRLRSIPRMILKGNKKQLTRKNIDYAQNEVSNWVQKWESTIDEIKNRLKKISNATSSDIQKHIQTFADQSKNPIPETRWKEYKNTTKTFNTVSKKSRNFIQRSRRYHQNLISFLRDNRNVKNKQKLYYRIKTSFSDKGKKLLETLQTLREKLPEPQKSKSGDRE